MIFILLVFCLATVRAQNECSCYCCIGQGCPSRLVGNVNLQTTCSADTCLAQCRCSYVECVASLPYGQAYAQCKAPVNPPSRCLCRCCNGGGQATCQPNIVGEAVGSQCTASECGIACFFRYPTICVWNGTGVTNGDCIGPVTTTMATTTTTYNPWLGNLCSCCRGNSPCSSSNLLGITSASQCSSSACAQACQNRYVTGCLSSPFANQISGTCAAQTAGNIKCRCNCCSGPECFDYELNANGSCSSCTGMCQQMSPCQNNMYQTTFTCLSNHADMSIDFSRSIHCLIMFLFSQIF